MTDEVSLTPEEAIAAAIARAWKRNRPYHSGEWRKDRRKPTQMKLQIDGLPCMLTFTHRTYHYPTYSPEGQIVAEEIRHYFYLHSKTGTRVTLIYERRILGDRQARVAEVIAWMEDKAYKCFGFVPTWIT